MSCLRAVSVGQTNPGLQHAGQAHRQRGGLVGEIAVRPNKGMKQTKPAQAMELRSLSPVLGRPWRVTPNE
jgi:hypothetical protein